MDAVLLIPICYQAQECNSTGIMSDTQVWSPASAKHSVSV